MRAALFDDYGEPGVLYVSEIPIPDPGPGQVRIRVMAAALNPIDWKVRSGRARLVKQFPSGTGRDAAGIVDAVGRGVGSSLIGHEVIGLCSEGAVAEHCILHHWADKPEDYSWREAAAIPLTAETALRVIRAANVQAGMTVLVDGASGAVGLATLSFARHLGFTVVGTCSPVNARMVRGQGGIPIEHGAWSPSQLAEAGVTRIDRVFDFSGRDLEALIAVIGDPSKVVGIVDHVNGPKLGIHDSNASPSHGAFDAIALAADLAHKGEYFVRLGRSFPMEQIADAHQAVFDGTPGKVTIPIGAATQA